MKRGIVFAALILFMVIFLYSNQYSNTKYQKSVFEQITKLNELTQEEKNWLAEHGPLVYGADAENAPFRFADIENGQYLGLTLDYMDILAKELDTSIIYQPLDYDKTLTALQGGQIDFYDTIPFLDKEGNYEFSYPIFRAQGIVVVQKHKEGIDPLKELKNKKVAFRKNETVIDAIKREIGTADYVYVSDMEKALTALKEGDIQAVVGDEPVIIHYLKRMGLENDFEVLNSPLYEKNYVLAVSKSDKMLYTILNKGIYNLEYKNSLVPLEQKWFGVSVSLKRENISDRITMIILILMMALSIVFYFFYSSNKTLYKELEGRMEELTNSRNDLQITFDGLIHYMMVVDNYMVIKNINEAFCQRLQTSRSKILGKSIMENARLKMVLLDLSDHIVTATFNTGVPQQREFENEGGVFQVHTFPLKDKKDRIPKVLIMILNITKERINEKQLLQDNKMAAIGQLAAGVAHEIRNPLGIIRNYCYILKNTLRMDEPLMQKSISTIEASVEKASNIINNLLNFSKMSNDHWDTVYLKNYIESIIDLENNSLSKKGIDVEIKCDTELVCYTNIGALEIIFLNLISNSIDAMPEGGRICIECNSINEQLQFAFNDTGIGIRKEDLQNIFNPFFTTKSVENGIGLGLYITYNEIQKLGGEIMVSSEVGKGTTFYITIPLKGRS
jgi:signal transduction histidine kinase/ABC-type amino acid transport substrate-binding protein